MIWKISRMTTGIFSTWRVSYLTMRPYIIPISYTHEPSPLNTTHQYMYYTIRNLSDFGRTYPTFVLLPPQPPCDYSSHAMLETSDQHNI